MHDWYLMVRAYRVTEMYNGLGVEGLGTRLFSTTKQGALTQQINAGLG